MILVPASAVSAASYATNGCSRATSDHPTYIRVLRVSTGRVTSAYLAPYVQTVMSDEWPGWYPQALLDAAALAVRQYAVYHAQHPRRSVSGYCYDVKDSTSDQLYRPARKPITAATKAAVSRTWRWRITLHGSLMMTGYRSGYDRPCGADATGYKLYARSAFRCASQGWSAARILRRYYYAGTLTT